MENYYNLLGLNQTSDLHLIRSSFRKKAKTCHPDLFSNASENEKLIHQKKFVKLSQAYETLSDPKKRIIYDLRLKKFLKTNKQTTHQKKETSTSFYSNIKNSNKNTGFSKKSKTFDYSVTEDSLENLIDDIKKMMDQFEINYRDPLELLVEWAKSIFQELNDNFEKPLKNFSYENRSKSKNSNSNHTKKDQFKNVEEELEHLKKKFNSDIKFSKPKKSKSFENEIEQELRSIKKKYRI